jgi:predicted RNA-binding protein with RPS1 domain
MRLKLADSSTRGTINDLAEIQKIDFIVMHENRVELSIIAMGCSVRIGLSISKVPNTQEKKLKRRHFADADDLLAALQEE